MFKVGPLTTNIWFFLTRGIDIGKETPKIVRKSVSTAQHIIKVTPNKIFNKCERNYK